MTIVQDRSPNNWAWIMLYFSSFYLRFIPINNESRQKLNSNYIPFHSRSVRINTVLTQHLLRFTLPYIRIKLVSINLRALLGSTLASLRYIIYPGKWLFDLHPIVNVLAITFKRKFSWPRLHISIQIAPRALATTNAEQNNFREGTQGAVDAFHEITASGF